jgi:DNA invertase Pin-like site-specific DNA recombinase
VRYGQAYSHYLRRLRVSARVSRGRRQRIAIGGGGHLKADEAVKLFKAGRSVTDIATALNIGRGSVYRALEYGRSRRETDESHPIILADRGRSHCGPKPYRLGFGDTKGPKVNTDGSFNSRL